MEKKNKKKDLDECLGIATPRQARGRLSPPAPRNDSTVHCHPEGAKRPSGSPSIYPSFHEKNDEYGDPLVQEELVSGFELCSGDLVDARLGFCVYTENPENPIIILHPALTGSPKAFIYGNSSQGDGWWINCIGPKKFLDTERFTVICVDHFGGNGASSSARELSDYKHTLSFADGVNLTIEVLKRRGVSELHAVVGGSIGGGQASEWLFQEQIKVKKIFDISGSFCFNKRADEYFRIQSDLIWGKGQNAEKLVDRLRENSSDILGQYPAFDHLFQYVAEQIANLKESYTESLALEIARKVGFFRFVTPKFYQEKWDRYFTESSDKKRANSQIESWIDHQGKKFIKRFDADALALLCRMDADASLRETEEVASILAKREIELIGFSVEGDILFPADIQERFYQAVELLLPEKKKDLASIIFVKDEINGHDHFLTEKFLDSVPELSKRL